MPGDIAGALAHHAEQLAEVPGALGQKLFLLSQFGFLTVEFGFQALGFGLLGIQCGARAGKQLGTLAAFGDKRLLARLHGGYFGTAFATNALQQLIGAKRLGGTGECRQQRQAQGDKTTAHGLASRARVFTGRSSNAGACSWRAMAMA